MEADLGCSRRAYFRGSSLVVPSSCCRQEEAQTSIIDSDLLPVVSEEVIPSVPVGPGKRSPSGPSQPRWKKNMVTMWGAGY